MPLLKIIVAVIALSLPLMSRGEGSGKDSARNGMEEHRRLYSFIIQDSPARIFTMRQVNEDYLGLYRLAYDGLGSGISPGVKYLVQALSGFAFFIPLTHEEAHRSILNANNIGSVSNPFFFSSRGGYVNGITDKNLAELRNSHLPEYMRLYSSGLESDYLLAKREESLFAFGQENFSNLGIEYLLRKAMMLQYYLMGLVRYDIDGDEESNELLRDAVGNDVYGFVRHLHRPAMAFHRYTRYADLTPDEVDHLRRIGFRSLLNLINPNLIGIPFFRLSNGLQFNAGMGYAICPFGDFTEQNFWITGRRNLMVEAYFRQYRNRTGWFPAGGFTLRDYRITPGIFTTFSMHLWQQPDGLSFDTSLKKAGIAAEWTGRFFLFRAGAEQVKRISVDVGILCKSEGYLPEESRMDGHFGLRFGTTLWLDRPLSANGR